MDKICATCRYCRVVPTTSCFMCVNPCSVKFGIGIYEEDKACGEYKPIVDLPPLYTIKPLEWEEKKEDSWWRTGRRADNYEIGRTKDGDYYLEYSQTLQGWTKLSIATTLEKAKA